MCSCGYKHWGLHGAAGLLLVRLDKSEPHVLLQLRAAWTHGGGTWALPGGALDSHEDSVTAAGREAAEEAEQHPGPHGAAAGAYARVPASHTFFLRAPRRWPFPPPPPTRVLQHHSPHHQVAAINTAMSPLVKTLNVFPKVPPVPSRAAARVLCVHLHAQ